VEEIAQVYSRALYNAARENDKLDLVRDQLAQFASALGESRDLQVFFFSPYFATEEKKEGLARALSGADELLENFLQLLIENHRMPTIFRIRRIYDELWAKENRLLPVQITSAVALDEETVQHIAGEIGKRTDRKVDLATVVEPDILGGIVVRVGNTILDASVRNRLERLRKQVAKAF
jgi:F-type H+-transporting ATPase subunit delta